MPAEPLPPLEQWLSDFGREPLPALDQLLLGRVSLGRLNRLDADEFLYRLAQSHQLDQTLLDEALVQWFEQRWNTEPVTLSPLRWTEILTQALGLAPRLPLPSTRQWLHAHQESGRRWLHTLTIDQPHDPEAALLHALALTQPDQTLLPLWLRLCRLEEDRPRHYFSLGLIGLRKLPDEDGQPPGDLPEPFYRGLVESIEAIHAQAPSDDKLHALWRTRVKAILALYPRSDQVWAGHFLPLLQDEQNPVAARELARLLPPLRQTPGRRPIRVRRLDPPSRREYEPLLRRLEQEPLEQVQFELDGLFNRLRHYTRLTGDVNPLVKTFSNAAGRVRLRYPETALQWLEEAFVWDPHNPYLWTGRAAAELDLALIQTNHTHHALALQQVVEQNLVKM